MTIWEGEKLSPLGKLLFEQGMLINRLKTLVSFMNARLK